MSRICSKDSTSCSRTKTNGKYRKNITSPPVDQANIFSYIWFMYTHHIFWKGYKNRGLSPEDIDCCSKHDTVHSVTKRLRYYWTKNFNENGNQASLTRSLICAFLPYFIFPLMFSLFEECIIRIIQPLLLGLVIRYFSGSDNIPREHAYYSAAGMCICAIIFITIHHPLMMHMSRLGMRLRVACCSLMYQKALRLSRASINQTAVGQIVNIMSNDVNRFDEFSLSSCYLITGPIQMCIIIYIVWKTLGISSLTGISFLCLLIPFQGFMGKCFSIVRSKTARLTDKRLKFMNEIISGMRIIKMYNWERPFSERISEARRKEVKQIRYSLFLKSINICMFFIASRVILFACLFVYVILNNVLTAEKVFVTMAMLNTLRLTMTLMFPAAITAAAELKISIERIKTFLLLNEIQDTKLIHTENEQNNKHKVKLNIKNICASYNPQHPYPTLQDISLSLCPGDFLTVIGKVGSSKTAFIMSLLGELPLTSGQIRINGSISYASQEIWSFNDSIRQNILFGKEYDAEKYRKVIEICALERDLLLMPLGDRTLIGEKGVQLSGGQKARLNLARAVYRDSDIFFLDDPLSAVDAGVAKHILEKCILEHLSDKIRILVTHQVQFIEKATKILVLQDGRCLALGTYEELKESGINFMSLMETDPGLSSSDQLESDNACRKDIYKETEISLDYYEMKQSQPESYRKKTKSISGESISKVNEKNIKPSISDSNRNDYEIEDEEIDETTPVIKVQEESCSSGSIKGHVYMEYFRAGANCFLIIVILIFSIISQFLFHGTDIFLAYWTNKNQALESKLKNNSYIISYDNMTESVAEALEFTQKTDSLIYAGIVFVLFISTLIRSITFFEICNRASKNLHNQIFFRILRTPMRFFDENPIGIILNRFTKDLGIIDEMLPYVAFDLNLIASQAIGIILTVCFVNYYLLVPSLILFLGIIFLRSIYIVSARDIKRIEGMSRSPLYSHVDNTINGLSSIRAYGAQQEFERQFESYQNVHTASWFSFLSTSRCMGLTMDWLSIIFIIIVTLFVLYGEHQPGGNVGLMISSGLMLAGMTQWGVRQSCEFESQMTSVERIVQYKELEQEAPAKSLFVIPPSQWPDEGTIDFKHMWLSYDHPGTKNKAILKDITCHIKGGEKVGIVGRTGAGKSSTIGALFRLTEPSGSVLIDKVDIQKIGLDDLRKKISIIPQDPVIFSGTVRYNLDPFHEYSDSEIWSALEKVQLKLTISNFSAKLEQLLSESGANLSVGQRQLICLARAILRKNKILILDEATANVDYQTDNMIQRQLRSEFSECTVITIAHRLNSIIDADRVIVLEAGKIMEFDEPYLLLKKKGYFYKMCSRTGEKMLEHLYRASKRAHESRRTENISRNQNISSLNLNASIDLPSSSKEEISLPSSSSSTS